MTWKSGVRDVRITAGSVADVNSKGKKLVVACMKAVGIPVRNVGVVPVRRQGKQGENFYFRRVV